MKVPENAAASAKEDKYFMLTPVPLKTTIASRGYYLDFRAVPKGVKLKWSFNLEYYDIDLTIKLFRDGGPLEGEIVHEEKRGKTAQGEFPVRESDCTYEFKFDNSYSYMTSKVVSFTFDKA